MKTLFSLYLVFLVGPGSLASLIPDHLKVEGHAIAKRFAESSNEFEGHDVAYVLHETQPDTFHRIAKRDLTSVTNKETTERVRLDFHSGASLHLTLKKRSVVDADTEFYSNTAHGLVKREVGATDCYATGFAGEDSEGMAAVSLCDGLHGTLTTNGIEYYIHPVEQDGDEHKVHVLWRRATNSSDFEISSYDKRYLEENIRRKRKAEEFDEWKTETSLVIEMAMFTDARYWEFLHGAYPGRENDFLLISMAAVQALYGDKEKVGYDVLIKVKLIEHWEEDPEGYVFAEDVKINLESFCNVTAKRYAYDMHFLHTGIQHQEGPAVGVAYVGRVCTNKRCGNTYLRGMNRYGTIAHEIGHNLGFAHHDASKCPDEIKSQGGSFMGGGDGLNFSPCNKWELQELFKSGIGKCLFEETNKIKTKKKYVDQPRVLIGQYSPPSDQCKFLYGPDFTYFRTDQLDNIGVCLMFLCVNLKKNNPEYRKLIRTAAPMGFPCGHEMFCRKSSCQPWDAESPATVGWDIDYLRSVRKEPRWSTWSKKWGSCSRDCGTGVQIKERRCLIEKGPFLSTYCSGPSIKARLCKKKKPCPDEPATDEGLRQARGDEVCSTFHANNVKLDSDYLPSSKPFMIRTESDMYFQSKSCIVSCQRDPDVNGIVDGLMIDGTPCLETARSDHNLQRFNIELRCVLGKCMEFSDCPQNQPKDACGVCGGDLARCVSKSFTEDLPEGERGVLAMIPAGSTGVDVLIRGANLELWSADDLPIIGADGQYPKGKYLAEKAVDYAGTTWSSDKTKFLRADGPTDADVVVIVLRGTKAIGRAEINYLLL